MVLFVFLLFFFKHKTAYEMRISDWSSDVCSSDLDQDVSDELEAQCQGEGIVRTVVYAIDADDIDGQHEHVGDTYSEAAAREVVRRLKFETGIYSRAWGISTAHITDPPTGYLRDLADIATPTGLIFIAFPNGRAH